MESPLPSDPATTHSRAAMWAVESERRVARAHDFNNLLEPDA